MWFFKILTIHELNINIEGRDNTREWCYKKIDKTVKRCYSNIRKQHKGVPYRFLFGMGMPAIFYSVTVFDRD